MPESPLDPEVRTARRWRRFIRGSCLTLLALAGTYGLSAYRYWTNPPRLTRNFAAEWNAEIVKTPSEQWAWPVYRKVLLELADGRREPMLREAVQVLDDAAAEWVRKHEPAWEKVRQASRLPTLGYLYSDAAPQEDRPVTLRYADPYNRAEQLSKRPETAIANPVISDLLLTAQGESGDLVAGLAADALLAARDGDGARSAADLQAIFGLARQIGDTSLLVSAMIARRRYNDGLHAWGTIMQRFPQALDDAQLQAVAAAAPSVILRPALDGEAAMFCDYVQRMYTDDGNGDGYFYRPAAGQELLGLPPMSFVERVAAPLTAGRDASRRQTLAEYDR